MTLPPEYLDWVQRSTEVEHVSFRAFVKHFDLTDRESATQAYYDLLESDVIRQKRRDTLKISFNLFRKNYEERFWTDLLTELAKRALEAQTQLAANRAGFKVHKAGE
ncbi:hypothetical protein BGZ49_004858, partial [Haplosporangium sp. Z 27]